MSECVSVHQASSRLGRADHLCAECVFWDSSVLFSASLCPRSWLRFPPIAGLSDMAGTGGGRGGTQPQGRCGILSISAAAEAEEPWRGWRGGGRGGQSWGHGGIPPLGEDQEEERVGLRRGRLPLVFRPGHPGGGTCSLCQPGLPSALQTGAAPWLASHCCHHPKEENLNGKLDLLPPPGQMVEQLLLLLLPWSCRCCRRYSDFKIPSINLIPATTPHRSWFSMHCSDSCGCRHCTQEVDLPSHRAANFRSFCWAPDSFSYLVFPISICIFCFFCTMLCKTL